MRRADVIVGVAVYLAGAAVLAGCPRGKAARVGSAQPPTQAEAGPDSTDVLKTQIEEIMKKGKRGPNDAVREKLAKFALPDPDAWFTRVYGNELGGQLAAKYPTSSSVVANRLSEQLHLRHSHQRGYGVGARRYGPSAPDQYWPDEGATAEPMTEPTDLYAVTISLTPDPHSQAAGFAIYWFAYDQGAFYYIGKPGWDPNGPGKITSAERQYDW